MSTVANRYGKALMEAAEEAGCVPEVRRAFGALAEALKEHADFRALITKDLIPEEEKEKLLFSVFEPEDGSLMGGFLRTLADHRRLSCLPEIHEAFLRCHTEYLKAQGILEAEAVTAVPLTDAETEALTEALSRKHGMKILLTKRVDPAILGGIVVFVGSEVQDCSVKTRYESLKRHLKSIQL